MSYRLGFSACHAYDPGKPSITVSVRVSAGSVEVEDVAKVDTGASLCVFQRELGEALGLDIASGEPTRIATAVGAFETFGHEVRLTAVGVEVDAVVYFAAEHGLGVNVLGRRGWIDRLRLGLVDYDGLLFVSPYDDPAE